MFEERAADLAQALAEEEEKAKHLGKLKSKQEATIAELEERLLKDHQQRQEMDRTKRKVETEVCNLTYIQNNFGFGLFTFFQDRENYVIG